jgi:hypothetical protein
MKSLKDKFLSWIRSAAGRVSIILLIVSALLLLATWSNYDLGFMNERTAELANNCLIGLATNLIGIVFTVSFVQYFIDKQDKEREQKEEAEKILRYHKYMQILVRRYLMFYISLTTRLEDRTKQMEIDDNVFNRQFTFSDMADMFQTSLFLTEGFSDTSIELFYKAEHELREYMLRMLENIDFKYYKNISVLLLDFTTKSKNLDMSGQIYERVIMKKNGVGKEVIDKISTMIADKSEDWIGKLNRGELQGNIILPYVLLFCTIQGQVRMIKEYTDLIKKIDI